MVKFRQYLLLLWKNFVLQKRRPISTAFEIILPTLFILLLAVIKLNPQLKEEKKCVPGGKDRDECNWRPFLPTEGENVSVGGHTIPIPSGLPALLEVPPISLPDVRFFTKSIVFTPNTSLTRNIMNKTKNYLNEMSENSSYPLSVNSVEPFDTEALMVKKLMAEANNASYYRHQERDLFHYSKYLGGIVFHFPSENENDILPSDISYDIRLDSRPRWCVLDTKKNSGIGLNPTLDCTWLTQFAFPLLPLQGPRDPQWSGGGQPGYHREGFSALQWAIDRSLVEIASKNSTESLTEYPTVILQRFPYFEYLSDKFVFAIQNGLPILLMLAYVFSALIITRELVHEKEKRLKESMKMMGLANWVHWAAWFTRCFLFLFISILIITLIFQVGTILNHSDVSLIFVFLLLYMICIISFCFAVSVFFSRAVWGAAGGGIIWFLTYVPYYFLYQRYDTLSLTSKLLPSILINTNMAFGAQLIGSFEGSGVGVRWSNLFEPPTVDDNLTFAMILAMFVVDSIFYWLITWYVEAVFPGEYGIPLKFYFPFQFSYWCGTKVSSCEDISHEASPLLQSEQFEQEPERVTVGIQVRNIRKVFNEGSSDEKVAVNDLSLSMFEGQISALLGRNGAGKTTLMSMLTGLFPPTSGTAIVNGCDICSNISGVRENLGLCPQHNVLFDTLTVSEHLWFFARLKGCSGHRVTREVDHMLHALQIVEKKDFQTKTLSGGMKRKLSVGIALVAGSKVVMLDEPTSGMDPSARRATWDLLSQQKEGRTILLTTHHMDEADLLGDRIAIMANGDVRCCGSSLFLKSKYGVGYHLVVVKEPRCDQRNVTELIHSHIPTAKLESEHAGELSYVLPREMSSHFEQLFTELELHQNNLGIGSFGVSVTTMEEVFLKVSEDHDAVDTTAASLGSVQHPINTQDNTLDDTSNSQLADLPEVRPLKTQLNCGIKLLLQQFKAMLVKRLLYSKRYKMAIITQLLLPFVFTLVGLILSKTQPSPGNSPPILLTPDQYEDNYVAFYIDNNLENQDRLNADEMSSFYSSQFTGTKTIPHNVTKQRDLVDYLHKEWNETGYSFNMKYLVGASFESNRHGNLSVVGWFNNQAFHAVEVALTCIDNAIMGFYSKGKHTINVTNHPLPRTVQQVTDDLNVPVIGFTIAFNLLFGMAFLASSFVRPVVEEKNSKAKHIQFVSGVSPFSYWLSSFLWDMINYSIPCVFIVILFAAFQVPAYVGGSRLGIVILQLFLYGWSLIPLMYLIGFAFNRPSTAFILLTLFNIITGETAILIIEILQLPQLGIETVAKYVKWSFLVLPNFCFGQSLIDVYVNYDALAVCLPTKETRELCKEQNFTYQTNYLAWGDGGIGKYSVFMALEGIVFMTLVLLIESHAFEQFWYVITGRKQYRPGENNDVTEDSDVAQERARINELMASRVSHEARRDIVKISNLGKIYGGMACCGSKPVHAVCGISLGIQCQECFGLLGINGAGKTTTFSVLTGDLLASYGTAIMDTYDIRSNMTEVRQRIGYCPQFDALIHLLTGRELLTMFARLRGVPEYAIPSQVERLMHTLLLVQYADRLCGTYRYIRSSLRILCLSVCPFVCLC
jgi:ATP-binding cassette subfamily A (ABC1) protein 3